MKDAWNCSVGSQNQGLVLPENLSPYGLMKANYFVLLVCIAFILSCGNHAPGGSEAALLYKAWRAEYDRTYTFVRVEGSEMPGIHPNIERENPVIRGFSSYQALISSTDPCVDEVILTHLLPIALLDKQRAVPGDEFLVYVFCERNKLDPDLLLNEENLRRDHYQLSLAICRRFSPTYHFKKNS